MATKLEAFTAQQMLVDVAPEAYEVTIIQQAGDYKIKLSSSKDDTRFMLFGVDEIISLVNQSNAAMVIESKIYDFEERCAKQLLELMKFKRVGKHYERPGSEMKVWIFNLPQINGLRPPGKIFVTDMYSKQREEAPTAAALLEILASGRFV